MISPSYVKQLTGQWRAHAPRLWWGDRLDARFLVADAVRALRDVRVLDVGCNAGVMLAQVPSVNVRVGLDLSEEALRLARVMERDTVLVRGDMRSLPFPDASFDVVLFCGMVEVLPGPRKAAAIREVARVLRPRGALHLTTLNRRYPRYHQHPGVVTYEELEALLHPHFDAVIRGFNPVPPFPYGLPNRVLARIPRIWAILERWMERGVGLRGSCTFVVRAVKR